MSGPTLGRRARANIPYIGEGIVRLGLWTVLVPRNAWPLAALVIGLPLWWVLGLVELAPIALAVPMAVQLLRRRTIHLPGGFGWWLLFLGLGPARRRRCSGWTPPAPCPAGAAAG